jgi:hypothetical protein
MAEKPLFGDAGALKDWPINRLSRWLRSLQKEKDRRDKNKTMNAGPKGYARRNKK